MDPKKLAWLGDAPGGNYTTKVLALAERLGVGVEAPLGDHRSRSPYPERLTALS